jgi:hypothetical protein
MGRCGCGWLDQARELEGGVRVASGEMEGIFACEGALALDIRGLERLAPGPNL